MQESALLLLSLLFYIVPFDVSLGLLITMIAATIYNLTFVDSKICKFCLLAFNSVIFSLQIWSVRTLTVSLGSCCVGLMMNSLFHSTFEQHQEYECVFVALQVALARLISIHNIELEAVLTGLCAASTIFGYYMQTHRCHRKTCKKEQSGLTKLAYPCKLFQKYDNECPAHGPGNHELIDQELVKDDNSRRVRHKYSTGFIFTTPHILNDPKRLKYMKMIWESECPKHRTRNGPKNGIKEANNVISGIHWQMNLIDIYSYNMQWNFTRTLQYCIVKCFLFLMKFVLILAIIVINFFNKYK